MCGCLESRLALNFAFIPFMTLCGQICRLLGTELRGLIDLARAEAETEAAGCMEPLLILRFDGDHWDIVQTSCFCGQNEAHANALVCASSCLPF